MELRIFSEMREKALLMKKKKWTAIKDVKTDGEYKTQTEDSLHVGKKKKTAEIR